MTKKAVADGVVAAADVFTTADKEVPTQAAQIQNLILQGYDAIVINAASPDALNGAVKQACDAGIVVVSFDGIVTEPCAWRVVVDFKDMGKQEVEQMAKIPAQGRQPARDPRPCRHLDRRRHPPGHPRGRRRESRSSRSSARCTGDWDQTTAQKAVADRPAVAARHRRRRRPGRRRLWRGAGLRRRRQAAPDHHHGQPPGRAAVVEGAEGQGRLRDLVGLDRARRLDARLLGRPADARRPKDVPHDLLVPYLAFTQDDFEAALPTIEEGGVASHEYTQEDAISRRSKPT